jgi:hypothetical protein
MYELGFAELKDNEIRLKMIYRIFKISAIKEMRI